MFLNRFENKKINALLENASENVEKKVGIKLGKLT
jgi:hypothetical protein